MFRAICNSDICHTIGNVTYIMTEYIRDLFPKNFFVYTHLSTTMPYREFQITEKQLRQTFMKKTKPILIIRPRSIIGDNDIFMTYSAWTMPMMDIRNDKYSSNYLRLFRDDKNDITIGYRMERLRVECRVSMMFDTMIQQINIYNQFQSLFIENQIYWMSTALEVCVPKELIDYISEISGIPVRDADNGSVCKFLNYLTNNSNKYWTFKEKSSNQKEEFFVYYPITLEYVFTDFNLNDPNKTGDIVESATIDFTLTSEFNTISVFQISTERDDTKLKANATMKIDTSTGVNIIPYYTIDKIFSETNKDGWKLFFTNMFNIDDSLAREEPDTLSLDVIFKDSDLKEILDYHEEHGISNDILFEFIIMKNNQKLNSDPSKGKIDYVVDLANKEIKIYNKNSKCTYRLLIYINNLYIMTLMNTISEMTEKYDKGLDKPI